VLTLAAFFVVLRPGFFHLATNGVFAAILALALVQLVVQLFFFLHLGSGAERGSRFLIFAGTVGLVLIIVAGSIWIMDRLNYRMMASPAQMQQYISGQQGF
jgi:cytochrome o ubiquinol oxidase operon protein cyoD